MFEGEASPPTEEAPSERGRDCLDRGAQEARGSPTERRGGEEAEIERKEGEEEEARGQEESGGEKREGGKAREQEKEGDEEVLVEKEGRKEAREEKSGRASSGAARDEGTIFTEEDGRVEENGRRKKEI